MLNNANIQMTAKAMARKISRGEISFDCVVQRNYAWAKDIDRKSLLIHSMIERYPIPTFYFAKREDGNYEGLDGQQRGITITEYINNKFALSKTTPCAHKDEDEDEDVEIAGKYFDELPLEFQERIEDYSLHICYFENITDDEVNEVFFRINNGKPLTPIELMRVKAESLVQFQEIANHELIVSSTSELSKKGYINENIAMQIYVLVFTEHRDFSTAKFRTVVEKLVVKEEEIELLNRAMDYVKFAMDSLDPEDKAQKKILTKMKRKNHLIASVYCAVGFISNDLEIGMFSYLITNFFNPKGKKTTINPMYNDACKNGSARPENVRARIQAMDIIIGHYSNKKENERVAN